MSFAFIEGNAIYNRRLLASGYTREAYQGYIPEVILRLFVDYCKDSISWKISHDQFIEFQHKAEQQINHWNPHLLYGPIFSVRGLEFEMNVASVHDAEFVQFQIRLKSINLKAKSMQLQTNRTTCNDGEQD